MKTDRLLPSCWSIFFTLTSKIFSFILEHTQNYYFGDTNTVARDEILQASRFKQWQRHNTPLVMKKTIIRKLSSSYWDNLNHPVTKASQINA